MGTGSFQYFKSPTDLHATYTQALLVAIALLLVVPETMSRIRSRFSIFSTVTATAAAFSPLPLGSRSNAAQSCRRARLGDGSVRFCTAMAAEDPSEGAKPKVYPRGPPKPPPADGSEAQKKRHTLLLFGYTGTNYYGLQPQNAQGDPEKPTVSDMLRRALLREGFIPESNFAPLERTKYSLASRTDKGVHAACAAASLNLETYLADIVPQGELAASGDAAALEHERDVAEWEAAVARAEEKAGLTREAAAAQGTKLAVGRQPPHPEGEWQLSERALARINGVLPEDIRVFSGVRVNKRFDAREMASGRTYEYLLPLHAIGECSVEDFDGILRRFEGTHRFHNFASGLRKPHDESGVWKTDDGEEWPLGIEGERLTVGAYRSVVTARVSSQLTIEGTEYLVLRVAGLAFVLHQIRHMVGAALAVSNGIVPMDIFQIALKSPLRLDVSPLVPGMGLMLDRIDCKQLLEP